MSAYDRWLDHTCTIERLIDDTALDGHGQREETASNWSDLATGVSCRFMTESEQVASPSISKQRETRIVLLLPAGQDITAQDRISSIVDQDGNTIEAGPLNVTEVIPRRDGRGERARIVELEALS